MTTQPHPDQTPTPEAPSSTNSDWPRSTAVLGAAGLVGSGIAYNLAMGGLGDEIRLIDPRVGVATSHVIDISESQAMIGLQRPRVVAAGPGEAGPVDLVIVAASAPETPGGNRHDFLAANVALLDRLAPAIESLAGDTGLVLLLTNPIDVMADCLRQLTSIAPERILGYTVNDSVRFRLAIARELEVPVGSVQALVLGEHGVGQVPIFSRVTVNGESVELDDEQQARVGDYIDGWFARWSALEPGRSSGWTTGRGVRTMVEALAAGAETEAAVWTGEIDELDDTYVALPVRLTETGPVARIPDVSAEELAGLQAAATSIRAMASGALAD